MTSKTHKQFAISWVLLGVMILYSYGFSSINYYLALIIIMNVGKYGALFPDVDHDWHSVKEKTHLNWIINKIIHLTGGKHRSWQTHSWDVFLITSISSVYGLMELYSMELISTINYEVFMLILVGFLLGWFSHLFSDMLTSAGVRVFCFSDNKVTFVPKAFNMYYLKFKKGKLKLAHKEVFRFNTGDGWEEFVYKCTNVVNLFLEILAITFPYWEVIVKFISNFNI